jgi:hypothetical protein
MEGGGRGAAGGREFTNDKNDGALLLHHPSTSDDVTHYSTSIVLVLISLRLLNGSLY